MATSPAAERPLLSAARDCAEPSRGHTTSSPQVVGHAALAIRRPGGSPTRRHLGEALTLRLERLELDICSSDDGHLVARHDVTLPDGRLVGDLSMEELRSADRSLLTLDEVCEQLEGRVPLLLDLKTAAAAAWLGPWFGRRRDLDLFAVCTEALPLLTHLRAVAPRVARWPSFPDFGQGPTHCVRRVALGLWRSHASPGGLVRGMRDVHHAARQMHRRPLESLARLGGMPWRERLPLELAGSCSDLAAEGMCVQHWLVSELLVEQAHRARLHVNAWTVNNASVVPAIAAAGVDSITTDRVADIRAALALRTQATVMPRAG